jgi:hypothetical protein
MKEPVTLTPGELLLFTQIRMVARFQGWSFPKTVKKVSKLQALLADALAQDEKPADKKAAPAPTDPAVTQAEALLKEIQDMMKQPPPEPPAS